MGNLIIFKINFKIIYAKIDFYQMKISFIYFQCKIYLILIKKLLILYEKFDPVFFIILFLSLQIGIKIGSY